MPNGKSRNQIMTAFMNQLGTPTGFKKVTRRMALWGDVASADKPWLGVQELKDTVVQGNESTPSKTTMNLNLFIYIDSGKDPTTTPIVQMNDLIDAVWTALEPSPLYQNQTLGGLVSHCWFEGDVVKEPGDLDGDGIAIIPIKILIP